MAGRSKDAGVRAMLESLLCAHGEPLPVDKVVEVLGDVSRSEIERAFSELRDEYEADGRGFRVAQVAGGYQLRTAPEHADCVRRLLRERPIRLTRPMLETLAIVAYKQLVTRAEIEAIRGVDVDSVLSTLLERRLIRVAGRKEAPGRPLLYGTSREFLEVFGLKELADLPTLKELGDIEIRATPEIDLRRGSSVDSEGDAQMPAGTAIELRNSEAGGQEDAGEATGTLAVGVELDTPRGSGEECATADAADPKA